MLILTDRHGEKKGLYDWFIHIILPVMLILIPLVAEYLAISLRIYRENQVPGAICIGILCPVIVLAIKLEFYYVLPPWLRRIESWYI